MSLTTSPRPGVVLLNDTRADLHHGCSRVMRRLEEGLARQGLEVLARSPVRHDWAADPGLLAALDRARLVVINGEGTIHHGRPMAARLLSVLDHPGLRGRPVALVNALWQENPPDWARWADRLALASLRDGRSLRAFRALSTAPARLVPDLSLSERIAAPGPRAGVIVGDSVRPGTTELLARLARGGGHAVVPILSAPPRSSRGGRTALGRWWRRLRPSGRWWERVAATPGFALDPDEASHAARLARAELAVTGRFHGACLAMAAGTPFLALASNSWKVEALIEDAGLERWRLAAPEDLARLLARGPAALGWTDAERAALDAYLDDAARGAEALFADLAALAKEKGREVSPAAP